jgi:hypothetical protein
MINISYEENPELYEDYEKCINFLRGIKDENYEYPQEKVKFHVYTEVKTPKELMVVKSYLATQNLDKTEMIVWSDYDISDNKLIQPYRDLVTFKVYHAEEEAIGTPFEGNQKLKMKDRKYYLQSDLARILLLYKYGGVWCDMDVILLRDFKPILDQEYMYMWGSEVDFANQGACATVLSGKSKSRFMTELVQELINTPPEPETTCWGKDMFAKLYRRFKYDVMPASFFNIEWCINKKHPGLGDYIESQGFLKPLDNEDHLFLESFGWHWHNSSKKDFDIVSGSKFDLLTKIIDLKLEAINAR